MQTNTNNSESKTDSTQTTTTLSSGYKDETKPSDTSTAVDESVDDYGYDSPEDDKPVEKKEVSEEPKAEETEEEVKTKATGYGKEETPKEEETTEDDPKPDETDEEKVKKEISEAVKNLPDTFNKEKISEFALKNKLSKDQVEAYVNLAKDEQAALVKKQEEAVKKQRSSWKKELIEDPEFGGDNFDLNVDRVEKVLEKYMPSTKKVLTERGTMLPPYIMRDFLALSKVLNPVAKMVNGEPSVPQEKSDGNFLETMYE